MSQFVQSTSRSRAALCALTTGAVLATTATGAAAASTSSTADPAAQSAAASWSACSATLVTVSPNTTHWISGVMHGRAAPGPLLGKLGYVPVALASVDDDGSVIDTSREFAIDGRGRLHQITLATNVSDTVTMADQVVASRWGGIRLLAGGTDGRKKPRVYLYGVTDSGALRRYDVSSSAAPKAPTGGVLVSPSAGAEIRSMTWTRSGKVGRGSRVQQADVLLATTTKGALIELTLGQRSGTLLARKVLRPSTWNFDAISSGGCFRQTGRMIFVTRSDGKAAAYLDANAADGSAADFSKPRAFTLPAGRQFG